MPEIHDLIDENNNVIGTVERSKKQKGDMLRFVHIYIFDNEGNFIIQQRASDIRFPNLLSPSAAGHVDSGEDFEQAAYRELEEEIGVKTKLEYVCDIWGSYGLCKLYKGFYNGELKQNHTEVKTIDKISFHELKLLHKNYPYLFIKGFVDSFNAYLQSIYNKLDVVDSNDKVISTCTYDEMLKQKLSVRVVYTLVYNDKGEILLQHRGKNVELPYHLDFSSSGHVDSGEDYKTAAERETKEELGIEINLSDTEPFFYEKLEQSGKFCQCFKFKYNGAINFDTSEVENVVWLSLNEIDNMLDKCPFLFVNSFKYIYEKYKRTINLR